MSTWVRRQARLQGVFAAGVALSCAGVPAKIGGMFVPDDLDGRVLKSVVR